MSASQSPPRKRVRNSSKDQVPSGPRPESAVFRHPGLPANPTTIGISDSSSALITPLTETIGDDDEVVIPTPSCGSGGSIRRDGRRMRQSPESGSGGAEGRRTSRSGRGATASVTHNGASTTPSSTSSASESDEEFVDGGDAAATNSALLRKVRRVSGLSDTDREIVRLIGQHLTHIGLKHSAAVLMAETGCRLDQPSAARFRKFVVNGQWSRAVKTLEELKMHLENPVNLVEMKFLLLEQKYLELLYKGNSIDALKVLQTELTPLKHNQARTHELSSYLMFSSPEDLVRVTASSSSQASGLIGDTALSPTRRNSSSSGAGISAITNVSARLKLMDRLQTFLPASIMLPPRRLMTLLNQAAEFQTERCLYHNKSNLPGSVGSLFDLANTSNATSQTSASSFLDSSYLALDHQCSKQDFPCETIQILTDHCEEVWYVKFSPDGRKLASGSKDNTVIVWDFDPESLTLKQNKTLERHNHGASFFAWSPDSTRLAVCGPEDCDEVHLWNVDTGILEGKISHSTEDSLTTVSWSPDGSKIACGGNRGQFYQCDSKGTVLDSWEGVRVQCLSYRRDGKSVLAADTHHRLRSYNFEELSDYSVLQEDNSVMTFTLDDSDRYALLNITQQGIHMWDVEERCLIRKFVGVNQGFYTVYSCFGGADQNFIASGSEDNKVYIYHVKRENPIAVLSGHTRTVSCVSWNPVYPSVLVSASDDGTIMVWGPAEKYRRVLPGSPSSLSGAVGRRENGDAVDAESGGIDNSQQPRNHCSNGIV